MSRHWYRIIAWGMSRKQQEETGQGLAEYALILALVALGCVAALGMLGEAIANSPGFTELPDVF